MISVPASSNLNDTRYPYTTVFRSVFLSRVQDGQKYSSIALMSWRAIICPRHMCDPSSRCGSRIASRLESDIRSFSARNAKFWATRRSQDHTSELQSLMRISYSDFCLNKIKQTSSTPLLSSYD